MGTDRSSRSASDHGALVTITLALTQGPIDGWSSAVFIAPLAISILLAIGFFVWEGRLHHSRALLPSSVWSITNIVISSLAILVAPPFWATSQLQFSNYFQLVLEWSPIRIAAAMVPQGFMALSVGILTQVYPLIMTRPRIMLPIGATLVTVSEILSVFSNGGVGMDYWKFLFPGFVLGSAGASTVFFASAINLIAKCPPEMAGVAGGWVQVLVQVGCTITLAVQAGLQGEQIADWTKGSSRGFWFMFAWTLALALQYTVFYKRKAKAQKRKTPRKAEVMRGYKMVHKARHRVIRQSILLIDGKPVYRALRYCCTACTKPLGFSSASQ